MKEISEIEDELNIAEARLRKIEQEINEALLTPFFERDYYLFQFLNNEKKAYKLLVSRLKWILDE